MFVQLMKKERNLSRKWDGNMGVQKMKMIKYFTFMMFTILMVCAAFYANELVVSSLGCDSVDSTRILQKALDSGASRIIVD